MHTKTINTCNGFNPLISITDKRKRKVVIIMIVID